VDGPVTSPFADDPARTLTWEPDRSDPSIGHLMTKTVAGRRFDAVIPREIADQVVDDLLGPDRVETVKRGGRIVWSRPST